MAEYQFNSQEVCIFPKGNVIQTLNLQANQIGDGKPIVRNSYSNFNLITLERRILLNS